MNTLFVGVCVDNYFVILIKFKLIQEKYFHEIYDAKLVVLGKVANFWFFSPPSEICVPVL